MGLDKNIGKHMCINGDYVYQMGLEMSVASTMRVDGYFYVYQNYNTLESKFETPITDNFHVFSFDEDKQANYTPLVGFSIQKIPFTLKAEPPKTEIIEFEANVGERTTVKIKLDSLNEKGKVGQSGQSQADVAKNQLKVVASPSINR